MAARRKPRKVVPPARELAGSERRIGPRERRVIPREDGIDRRAGPATAARMARVRIGRDVDSLKESVKRGEWAEVARVAAGLAGEVGNFVRAAGAIPLGFLGRDLPARVEADKQRKKKVEKSLRKKASPVDADTPVVLLHGWFHNRTGFSVMARRMRAAGRHHVYALDLPTATTTIQRMAQILDDKIQHVLDLTGAEKVDVVAHSLGGLVARWWIHHEGGASKLRHLVTLGAPHRGTALAAFVPIGSGKAINVGSDVVRALDVPPPRGVRITSIWSDMDYLIIPPEGTEEAAATLGSAERNVRVRYVGHMSLLYSRSVFREVLLGLQRDEA